MLFSARIPCAQSSAAWKSRAPAPWRLLLARTAKFVEFRGPSPLRRTTIKAGNARDPRRRPIPRSRNCPKNRNRFRTTAQFQDTRAGWKVRRQRIMKFREGGSARRYVRFRSFPQHPDGRYSEASSPKRIRQFSAKGALIRKLSDKWRKKKIEERSTGAMEPSP